MSKLTFLAGCALLGLPATLAAQQLVVPSTSYPTIQSAIDAATASNSVSCLPGTYRERIDFKGKSILVRSLAGPASTTIDGGKAGSTVSFLGGETRQAILDGFTITGGVNTAGTLAPGGGIKIKGASPTIRNCRIVGNLSPEYGGGIGVTTYQATAAASPLIEDCLFENNEAGGPSGVAFASGGAIGFSDFSTAALAGSPEVRRCSFFGNKGAQRGGAMILTYGFKALVEDCVFSRNTVGDSSAHNGGSAIHCGLNSVSTFRNNRFWDNTCPDGGGVVKFFNVKDPVFVNNTVAGNKGGGVAVFANTGAFGTGTNAIVTNCIFWANGTPEVTVAGNPLPTIQLTYSDVQGGYTGTGNVNADPRLANIGSGNHRLLGGSPCFNTGDNAALQLPSKDFEGDPRVVAARVDMGADELAPRKLLYADRATMSVQTGATTKFTIEAGSSLAGNVHVILPGLSGTYPGTQLGSVLVPLNVDAVTLLLVPILPGLVGVLDGSGSAQPSVPFTGPLPSVLIGQTMSFAALFLVPNSNFSGASNDENIRFVQ